ncbi:MAG TPA: branched-chain amino acid ABC transporter permease [Burkholderiaceae bacterium]|nr:branched-chain amino acid ABC transporter permease [Burkholderiaceae bacterium]
MRPLGWTALAAVLVLLTLVPWIASPALVQFGTTTLLLATLAQSWNLIGGYTGYASFGNSVFYGIGGYGTAIAMVQFGLPFGIGILLGGMLAVFFALLLGLPVLRLRGHYFAIATLALAEAMTGVVSNLDIAGRNIGLVLPLLKDDVFFYESSLSLLVLATLIIFWISRSRFGYGLVAIREDEDAAGVMGVNTTLYKAVAFTLAGFFSAMAGGIHAYWITFIDPVSAFDITLNVMMIIMAIFGGAGTILGPLIGAALLASLSEVLATEITGMASLFFGLVIVVAVIFMPRGLTDLMRRFRALGWRYFRENLRLHRL